MITAQETSDSQINKISEHLCDPMNWVEHEIVDEGDLGVAVFVTINISREEWDKATEE